MYNMQFSNPNESISVHLLKSSLISLKIYNALHRGFTQLSLALFLGTFYL